MEKQTPVDDLCSKIKQTVIPDLDSETDMRECVTLLSHSVQREIHLYFTTLEIRLPILINLIYY